MLCRTTTTIRFRNTLEPTLLTVKVLKNKLSYRTHMRNIRHLNNENCIMEKTGESHRFGTPESVPFRSRDDLIVLSILSTAGTKLELLRYVVATCVEVNHALRAWSPKVDSRSLISPKKKIKFDIWFKLRHNIKK